MTLTFPTIAEQVLSAFRKSPKTVSISTIARKYNAHVEYTWPGLTTFIFEDDTSLTVRGRGRAHEIETHLP